MVTRHQFEGLSLRATRVLDVPTMHRARPHHCQPPLPRVLSPYTSQSGRLTLLTRLSTPSTFPIVILALQSSSRASTAMAAAMASELELLQVLLSLLRPCTALP